jgi:peptide/nickel transport system permease protein
MKPAGTTEVKASGRTARAGLKRPVRALESAREFFKEVWSYTAGKFGVIMLCVLIVTSIYALLVIPPEFVSLWEAAPYWEENPQLVPPAWVCSLGVPCAPHFAGTKTQPDVAYEVMGKYYYNYTFTYDLGAEVFPQDLLVKLVGIKVPIVGNKPVQPTITVTIQRPDGLAIKLGSIVVSANATGGQDLVKVGTKDSPLKVDIDVRSLTLSIADYYNLRIPAEIVGADPALQGLAEAVALGNIEDITRRHSQDVIFGKPRFSVKVRDQSVYLSKIISELDAILRSLGKSTDPKQIALKSRLTNVINILMELNNSKTSLAEFVAKLKTVKTELENAWKEAFVELLLPSEQLSKLSDLAQFVDKYVTRLSTTGEYFAVSLDMQPLPGRYLITVSAVYDAREVGVDISGLTSPPIDQVRVVIKGTAYGLVGTDDLGRDLAQLLLYGFPIALGIGAFSAFVTTIIGLLLGVISGYYGGVVDEVIQRTADIIGNIPWLPVLIMMAYIAQQLFAGYPPAVKATAILMTIMGVLILTGWGGLAITVRAMTLSIKEEPYVEAALALGASKWRIIVKHILPQVGIYAVASLVSGVPGAILTEAGLSVLGIRHGWPTWGAVLSRARDLGRYDVWWWILPPGILLSTTSLTFIALGLAIEKIVEPRLRTL